MTCQYCKHWGTTRRGEPAEANRLGMKICTGIREVNKIEDDIPDSVRFIINPENGWKYSNHTSEAYQKAYKEAGEKELAAVEDASTYYAALLTHPSFKCCKFEENPKAFE